MPTGPAYAIGEMRKCIKFVQAKVCGPNSPDDEDELADAWLCASAKGKTYKLNDEDETCVYVDEDAEEVVCPGGTTYRISELEEFSACGECAPSRCCASVFASFGGGTQFIYNAALDTVDLSGPFLCTGPSLTFEGYHDTGNPGGTAGDFLVEVGQHANPGPHFVSITFTYETSTGISTETVNYRTLDPTWAPMGVNFPARGTDQCAVLYGNADDPRCFCPEDGSPYDAESAAFHPPDGSAGVMIGGGQAEIECGGVI